MSWGVLPLVYFIWYSFHFLDLSEWFLSHVREVFGYYIFKYFFCHFLSLFSFWHPYNNMLVCLTLSQSSLRLSSFLFNLFSLFCSAPVIATNLSSTLLIHSSASCILLLAASNEFFISVIVFWISSCLSFILYFFSQYFLWVIHFCLQFISNVFYHFQHQQSKVFFLEAENLLITYLLF